MSAEFSQYALHSVPDSLSLQYQLKKEEPGGAIVAQDKYAGNKEVLIEAWSLSSRPDVLAMMDFQSAIYDLKFNPLPGEPAIVEIKDDSFAQPPLLYTIQEYHSAEPALRNERLKALLAQHLGQWLSGKAAAEPLSAALATDIPEREPLTLSASLEQNSEILPAVTSAEETPKDDWPAGEPAAEERPLAERAKAAADAPMVAVMARLMAEAKEALNAPKKSVTTGPDTEVPVEMSAEKLMELQDLATSFTIWANNVASAEAAAWEKRFNEAPSFNERAAVLEEWNERHLEKLAQAEAAAEERANRYSKYSRYGKGDKSSPLVGIIVGAIWLTMMFIQLYIEKCH